MTSTPSNKRPAGNRPAGAKSTKALQKSSSKGMWITVGALVVVAALVFGAIIWWAKSGGDDSVSAGPAADQNISFGDGGTIKVGKEGTPVVDMWEDGICPACGQFEKQNHDAISDAVLGGKVQMQYHMMNFLDRSSKSGTYSTRLIAALQCIAATESAKTFFSAKSAYFTTDQPAEGTGDRTTEEIAKTAGSAGASDKAVSCIKDMGSNGKQDQAKSVGRSSLEAMQAITDKVGTPTVAHDGKVVSITDPNWLTSIIGAGQ